VKNMSKCLTGWTVNNVLYQRLLVQAQRTQCQSLIDQVKAMHDASRADLVTVLEPVSQAAKGRVDPDTLNLQEILSR